MTTGVIRWKSGEKEGPSWDVFLSTNFSTNFAHLSDREVSGIQCRRTERVSGREVSGRQRQLTTQGGKEGPRWDVFFSAKYVHMTQREVSER